MSQPEAEAQTQARSRLYGLLESAFAFPEGALYRDLMGGVWQSGVVETLQALPFSVGPTDLDLPFREAGTPSGDGDRGSFLRAERDFLERYLVRFLVVLAEVGCRFTPGDRGYVTAAMASP